MIASSAERFALERITAEHDIAVDLFIPFTIARLGGLEGLFERRFTIELRNLLGPGSKSEKVLDVYWSGLNTPNRDLAIDDQTLTEWAACGVASVLISHYAGKRIIKVTGHGEGFDFWVGQGDNCVGLEVSGMTAGRIEARHAAKVRQLLGNPFRVDGYVVVVDFVSLRAILSFHRFDEVDR